MTGERDETNPVKEKIAGTKMVNQTSEEGSEGTPSVAIKTIPITVGEYLEATAGASDRTRYVTITMIIASLLVLIATLNSMQSWMLKRIQAASDANSPYVASKIGVNKPNDLTFERRYEAYYTSLVKTYAENAYYLKVPFLGFSYDINDLGIFGGVAFVIILTMAIYCLQRERENIHLSFQGLPTEELPRYYTLLSMRQVFTTPPSSITRVRYLSSVFPKLIWLAPVAVHSAVVAHDQETSWMHEFLHTPGQKAMMWEIRLGVLIVGLTVVVLWRLVQIDLEWWRLYRQIFDPQTARNAIRK